MALPNSVRSKSLSVWRWRLANRSMPTSERCPMGIAKIATSLVYLKGERHPEIKANRMAETLGTSLHGLL